MELLFGAIVSLLVELLKKRFDTEKWMTLSLVVVLALLAGLYRFVAQDFGFWEQTIQVLSYAGAFYAFIIKNLEDLKE